jgi:hypothetical protein
MLFATSRTAFSRLLVRRKKKRVQNKNDEMKISVMFRGGGDLMGEGKGESAVMNRVV